MAHSQKTGVPGEVELSRAESALENYWDEINEELDLEGSLEENFLPVRTDSWKGDYGELRLPGSKYTGKIVSDNEGNISYQIDENEPLYPLNKFELLQPEYNERDYFLEQVKEEFGYGTSFSIE